MNEFYVFSNFLLPGSYVFPIWDIKKIHIPNFLLVEGGLAVSKSVSPLISWEAGKKLQTH